MNARSFELDLTRPLNSGVYFVAATDLAPLARRAARDELVVCGIDLSDCHDKDELLQRLATTLQFPATFGYNWDALADCLRDPVWLPGWGHVLLFEHSDELRRSAEADFNILLGILDDAATFGLDNERPWFAFLALPDDGSDDEHTSR